MFLKYSAKMYSSSLLSLSELTMIRVLGLSFAKKRCKLQSMFHFAIVQSATLAGKDFELVFPQEQGKGIFPLSVTTYRRPTYCYILKQRALTSFSMRAEFPLP